MVWLLRRRPLESRPSPRGRSGFAIVVDVEHGWRHAVVSGFLGAVACGPSPVAPADGQGASSGSVEVSSSGVPAETSSGSSSSGEPELEGPGCGEPPPCDRGTFDGHVRIESEADLAQFEGYTEVTGMLEVLRSDDLVCLDGLACLETVGQSVRIQENTALRSTQGLRNVRSVGERGGLGSAYVYVGENAALESLEGFAASDRGVMLALWKNPALREVSAFSGLSGVGRFLALENPLLQRLFVAPREFKPPCVVNRNPQLCSAELEALCDEVGADASFSTVLHGDECPEGPAEPWVYDPDSPLQCLWSIQDCPEGQQCGFATVGNADGWACAPLPPEPVAVGAPCSAIDDPCGRYRTCWWGRCLGEALLGPDVVLCTDETASPFVDASGVLVACIPNCDPLGNDCDAGYACYPGARSFECRPVVDKPASDVGAPCSQPWDCQAGLVCADSGALSSCEPGTGGCCTPYCDVRDPECPAGTQCVSWWGEGSRPPLPVVEHVGVCLG